LKTFPLPPLSNSTKAVYLYPIKRNLIDLKISANKATTGAGDIRSRLRKIPETWPCILESLQAGGEGESKFNLVYLIKYQ
jgi:hypothetical protein